MSLLDRLGAVGARLRPLDTPSFRGKVESRRVATCRLLPLLALLLFGATGCSLGVQAAGDGEQTSTPVPTAAPASPSPTTTTASPPLVAAATPTPIPVPTPAAPISTPTRPPAPTATIAPLSDPLAAGKAVFMANCTFCHPDGDEGLGPSIKKSRKTADEIRTQARGGKDIMPAFGPERISDTQLENLIRFELSIRQ